MFGGERWEVRPLLRAASSVHQDGGTVELGAGSGHLGIPEVAADIVDDLGSGFDGCACGGGVECVDGEDGAGLCFQDGRDDGEDAGLFFVGGEWCGVGPRGFATDVEDVCAFVDHLCGLGEGTFGGVIGRVEEAPVREGVGRDVEDAHDDGSRAEGQGSGAEMPVVMAACREGHGEILVVARKSGYRAHLRRRKRAEDGAPAFVKGARLRGWRGF